MNLVVSPVRVVQLAQQGAARARQRGESIPEFRHGVSIARGEQPAFQPATSLNLLVAAWLQFMVHDWLSHGSNEKDHPFELPLEADDPWPDRPMKIPRTRKDPTRTVADEGSPPTYANTATHWWDASQLYGSDAETVGKLRSGVDGKLTIGSDGLLPLDPKTGTDLTGVNGNYWIGLSLFHTLFAHEHNAICDHLKSEYPTWSDDDLFDHARLINAALLAKIHTVEWTPAIIAHPTTQYALYGNWYGIQGQHLRRVFGRLSDDEVISGIPGMPNADHHGVPYSITEEFVAVYRMHPLIPDEFSFRSAEDDQVILQLTFPEVAFGGSRSPCSASASGMGCTRPAGCTLARSPCTTIPGFCSGSRDRTHRSMTWRRLTRRLTCCASASVACHATTTSASCCTSHASRASRR